MRDGARAGTGRGAASLAEVFHGSPALRAAIERVAVRRRLEPGAVLFRKDDDADSFYLLDAGEIEISVTSAEGRKLALEVLTPPAVFGEIGLFAGRRTADAAALTPAVLRGVRRGDLLEEIREEPDLALAVIDLLCARLRAVSDKLEERAFLPLPARLARRVLHLTEAYAGQNGTIPLSQAELADFAGATREAVAKALASWRQRGWIELSRGAIHVRDPDALALLAEDPGT